MLCQAMDANSTDPLAWNVPTQERSRARVAAILEAARELAEEAGHLDLGMTDVAKRAGVPVGSVYQYFPTRAAMLGELFRRAMEPIDSSLAAGLAGVERLEDFVAGVEWQLMSSAALVREDPWLAVIFGSQVVDPVLERADFANSRANAEAMAEALVRVSGGAVTMEDAGPTALLICHLWGSVMRMCALLEDQAEADGLLKQYAGMIRGHVRQLADGGV